MDRDYSEYLQFLAAEHNILYIGRESEIVYDEIASYFLSTSKIDINEKMLEKIISVLIKRHIDIVVIDAHDNNPLAINFFNVIKAHKQEIPIMLIFDPTECNKSIKVISLADMVVTYPIKKDDFYKRVFTVLSRTYAINSIGRRDILLKQKDTKKEDELANFFDTYEGSALFLADDLMEIVENLNSGNLTHQFLLHIAGKLDEVANIFAASLQTKHVAPIYEDLASYLRKLKLSDIKVEYLNGFSYLSNILSDVSVYLMDMFVDRIFKDVHVFEHSLKSNIEFMQNRLEGRDEFEGGELDFF